MEKLLPQNLQAERGVLGSIIIDPDAVALVADFLQADDFYRDAHRSIYEAIHELYNHREPADFLTLCDELERRNKLDDIGGASYITSLINQVPTSANAEYYGRIVERTAVLRRLIHGAGEIAAMAYDEVDNAVERAEEIVYHISHDKRSTNPVVSAGTILTEYAEELLGDQSQQGPGSIVGVPSGFELDMLTGGFQKSDLIVLAARPAMGKTSLCLNMARNAAMDHGRGVLLFSLEMSKKQLIQRLVAQEARVDLKRLRMKQLYPDEVERAINAFGPIAEASLYIDDTAALSPVAMRSKIRRTMTEHDVDIIIVDYLQKMQGMQDGKRIRDRYQEVSEIARSLKDIAKEFDVPVLALAQLSRAVESRADKIPQMSDLRDSGEIEQEADIILFIHRDDYYAGFNPDGTSRSTRPKTADLIISKHRNGPEGDVVLGFEAPQTRFYNLMASPAPIAEVSHWYDDDTAGSEDRDGDDDRD
jgi:replicative DNA helicase